MPSSKRLEKQADIFARAIHDGKSQRTAYRESHPESTATDESADELGNRWYNRVEVQSRLAELTEQAKAGAIIDDQRAQAMLTMIAMGDNDARARIAALDQLAKRQGCYIERQEQVITADVSASLTLDEKKKAFAERFSLKRKP